ncbi:putative membrane protein [Frankia sp. EI5c]|nr:putative membrane protein [Frankia sp. EI5c]
MPAGGRAEAATEHTRMPRTAERRVTALLLMMTALTGLVDSMTFLGLGEVFVANMTGNVAVLGFSLAGASGISGVLSLDALACFVFGALVGGRISARFDDHSRLWLGAVTAVQALLLSGALLLTMFALHDDLRAAVAAGGRLIDTQPSQADYALVSMLAVGMGLQHATAQRLARPEIPTNVLTTTITTFVIQTRLGGGHGSRGLRQLVGPALLLTSAAVGALGFLKVAVLFPLICGLALTLASLALATVGSAPAPAGSRQRAPAGVTPPSRPE